FAATSDTSATLAVDGLSAKPIQAIAGTNLRGGEIQSGTIQRLTYSTTGTGQWLLQCPIQSLPVCTVNAYAGSSAPPGWLLCDGTGYSQTTYAALFNVIGTTYGSTASGVFSVPDLKGRTIAGKEASATRLTTAVSGINGATLGAAGGDQSMQTHNHGITDN